MSQLTLALGSKSRNNPHRAKNVAIKVLIYGILLLFVFITLFPYIWMVLTSFKDKTEAISVVEFHFFPEVFKIDSYVKLMDNEPGFLRAMLNTVIIEILVIPIGTLVSALAAFSFAKMRLPHKRFFLLFLMSGMMVPYAAVLLPQYRAFQAIGWTGDSFLSLLPLIVPGLFGNVSMMFFFIQYMKSTPSALIEAARIDGAGWLRVFFNVIFPVIIPAVAAQVIFWFLGIWNDYFAPSIYLSGDWLTLQALISALNDAMGRRTDITLVMAGATLGSLPMIVLYICFQKYFVQSLAMTGIKE